MICPSFLSSSERRELVACVRCQREDHGIARRAHATLLRDDGESCLHIVKFLYLDNDTIRGGVQDVPRGWLRRAFGQRLEGWSCTLRHSQSLLPNEWKTFHDQVTDNFRVGAHGKFRVLE